MKDDLSPLGRAALELIERGLGIIPLREGQKEPATRHGINDWSDNPEDVREYWAEHPFANVGVVCGQPSNGVVVIDLDVHDGARSGIETLREWEGANGRLPETWEQVTGSGGRQLFYRADREVRNSANGELGVDIRGDGGFVVVPPSVHPNGERYEWRTSPDDMPIADADKSVWAFIDHVRPGSASGDGGRKPPFVLPDVIDANRNDTLFKYLCSMREKGCGDDEIATLGEFANLKRCKPPLAVREVDKIVRSVCKYVPGNEIKESKQQAATVAVDGGEFSKAEKCTDLTSYEIASMLASDDMVRGSIRFNVLENRAWKTGQLPWDKSEQRRGLNDRDVDSLFGLFEYGRGIRSKAKFEIAINQYLSLPEQQMNPIVEAFDELPSIEPLDGGAVSVDGEERPRMAGGLIVKYLMEPAPPACEEDMRRFEYVVEAERLLLREIVGRAMRPGCKADVMPVLVGEQGIGKSTFVRALAIDEQFYLEGFHRFDDENKRRLIGRLVAEVSELDAFNYTELSSIKSVITTRVDNLRQPYERRPQDYPRTCVFVGTTNEGTFLNDQTGARRFLPIVCTRARCDAHPGLFDGSLERDVRQAMAETYAQYLADPDAFMRTLVMPKGISETVADVQAEHTREDYVYDQVLDYLDDMSVNLVNVKKVFVEGFGLPASEFTATKNKFLVADIRSALDRAPGWERAKSKKTSVSKFGRSYAWHRVGAPGA